MPTSQIVVKDGVSVKSVEAARAVSTPPEIDFGAVVAEVATRKVAIGATFNGRKGKQSLFAAVCKVVKSLRNMPIDSQLSSEVADSITNAIGDFWKMHASKLLSYGEVTSVRYDAPSAKFNKAGTEVESVTLKATLRAERACQLKLYRLYR